MLLVASSLILSKIIRDQLSISTWLSIGAIFNGALYLAIGRSAFLPATLWLGYRMLHTYLVVCGFAPNPHMANVIAGKTTTQFPNETGDSGTRPASNEIVVFLLGAKINQ